MAENQISPLFRMLITTSLVIKARKILFLLLHSRVVVCHETGVINTE